MIHFALTRILIAPCVSLFEEIKLMLTPKQDRFAQAYSLCDNGTEAAISAGYSTPSARSIASENLRKPEIISAIERHRKRHSANNDQKKYKFLEWLSLIINFDVSDLFLDSGEIKPLNEWPLGGSYVVKEVTITETIIRNPDGSETPRRETSIKFHARSKFLKLALEMTGAFGPQKKDTRDTRIILGQYNAEKFKPARKNRAY